MSLGDEILAHDDMPLEKLPVPEWGGRVVFVRSITSEERTAFDRETRRRRKYEPDRIHVLERLVILCTADEHGAPVFRPEQEDALSRKANAGVMRVFRHASKHNGFVDDDEEDAGNP